MNWFLFYFHTLPSTLRFDCQSNKKYLLIINRRQLDSNWNIYWKANSLFDVIIIIKLRAKKKKRNKSKWTLLESIASTLITMIIVIAHDSRWGGWKGIPYIVKDRCIYVQPASKVKWLFRINQASNLINDRNFSSKFLRKPKECFACKQLYTTGCQQPGNQIENNKLVKTFCSARKRKFNDKLPIQQ
jgi:hypothetical protein